LKHYLHVEAYENPIEKALEFKRIMKEENLNQGQLARKLGLSRVRTTQVLNILKLSQEQQDYVLEYGKERLITERQFRNANNINTCHPFE